jgi:NAD(P)-dependent dehydrogenase (short-subunit alcohol dehydrogenase family)
MDRSEQRFSGKVAVVPGSSANPSIGRACALRLAREGASVVVNGRDWSRLHATTEAFEAEGLSVVAVLGSMEDEATVAELADTAQSRFGGIDLVVNTIGGAPYRVGFEAISRSQLMETVSLNTWPALSLIQAALRHGLADGGGAVVNVSSGSPHKTTSSMVAYAAAKASLNTLTRTIAADLAPRGVRVNAVSPGLTRTTSTTPTWESDGGRAAGAQLPTGHLTEAEDIAGAVTFLLSDDARQITGVVLDVDGGNHLAGGGWSPIPKA